MRVSLRRFITMGKNMQPEESIPEFKYTKSTLKAERQEKSEKKRKKRISKETIYEQRWN